MTNRWWVNQADLLYKEVGYNWAWARKWQGDARADGTRSEDGQAARLDPSAMQMTRVEPGDLLLHYISRERAVVGWSTVKLCCPEQPNPHGSPDDPMPGTLLDLAFHEFVRPVSIDSIPIDLKQPISEISPFTRQGGVKQPYFHSIEASLFAFVFGDATAAVDVSVDPTAWILASPPEGPTDRLILGNSRAEQAWLRGGLLHGRASANCDLCGQELPATYLRAAHIKPRRDCTTAERIDLNVAMLACVFGCDHAFEIGHLMVDGNGLMQLAPGTPDAVALRFRKLVNKHTSAYKAETKGYFDSRRQALRIT